MFVYVITQIRGSNECGVVLKVMDVPIIMSQSCFPGQSNIDHQLLYGSIPHKEGGLLVDATLFAAADDRRFWRVIFAQAIIKK